jgi:hypothetical protein
MSEFEITDDKIFFIVYELEVEKNLVDIFLPFFKEFREVVRLQHLAPVIRALELYIRKKHNKPNFTIEYHQVKGLKLTCFLEWSDKYVIYIPIELSLRQTLIALARELGHIFYLTEYPNRQNNKTSIQKMANLFGALLMLEHNSFYYENMTAICYDKWEDIIMDLKTVDSEE